MVLRDRQITSAVMQRGGAAMSFKMNIAITLLITGVTAVATVAAVDADRIVKRIFYCSLTAIYVAAMLMIWGD